MIGVTVDASGLSDLELYFSRFPEVASKAMSIAINETARGPALDFARKAMTEEVNFPEGYLTGDRLGVVQWARDDHLEAVIRGRDRPTLLARFSQDRPEDMGAIRATNNRVGAGRSGRDRGRVTVVVHPNEPKRLASGFFVALRSGGIGLAIRLRPGETISNVRAYKPVPLFRDKDGTPVVYLLYGPSVDQVFRGVAERIAPQITEALEKEFIRQFARLSGATRL